MSETLFPSEEDLQRASRGAAGSNLSRRVAVDDALASFGSEGGPTADVSEGGTTARSGTRLPPIERRILGAEVVLPADPPIAPVKSRRPRLLVMLQIAAAVALGALLGLSYERYRLASSPATTPVVEIEPPATNPAASPESTPSTSAAGARRPGPAAPPLPPDFVNRARMERALSGDPSASVASPGIDAAVPPTLGALPSTVVAPNGIVPATGPSPDERAAESAGIEETSVRRVLNAYAHAYNRLDALAASALWPGVDRPALSRVFDAVSSQRVTLTRCDITIAGERATAQCAGGIEFIPSLGDPRPQSRNIDWTFDLNRSSGQWRISGLTTK